MIPNQGGFRQKPQDNSNFKTKGTNQKSVNFDMNASNFSGTQSEAQNHRSPVGQRN